MINYLEASRSLRVVIPLHLDWLPHQQKGGVGERGVLVSNLCTRRDCDETEGTDPSGESDRIM